MRVWEKSFNGLGREREEKAFREFSPSVLVWSKPLQGSRVSKKASRNILGGVCGSSLIVLHQSGKKKSEGVSNAIHDVYLFFWIA